MERSNAVIDAAQRVKSSNYVRAEVVQGEVVGQWFDDDAFTADAMLAAEFVISEAPRLQGIIDAIHEELTWALTVLSKIAHLDGSEPGKAIEMAAAAMGEFGIPVDNPAIPQER